MTPVYLNPPTSSFPLLELKEDQTLQLFLSPSSTHLQAPTSSIPCATFSNNSFTTQDQVHDGSALGSSELIHPEKAGEYSLCGVTTDRHVFPSSSTQSVLQPDGGEFENPKLSINDLGSNGDQHHHHSQSENGDYRIKWMSSKMRFMQKMKTNSNCTGSNDHKAIKAVHKFTDHHRQDDDNHSARFNFTSNNNIGNIRICTDCNTTTTPLWRSGPRGPKSLCNACGIRQRKARRAMEEAAAAASGVAVTFEGSTGTTRMNKVHTKDKKPRSGAHVGHYKKHGKAIFEKKMLFKNFSIGLGENSGFREVFSQDVAEAAILLMELSCGLAHG